MIQHIHKFQWYYMTFLVMVFFGLGAYYVIHLGYYPVAIVNSHLISARSLNDEYAVAYRYYANIAASQNNTNINSKEFRKEIRRASLNDLVDKELIYQGLQQRIGNQLAGVIENKINTPEFTDPKLEQAAKVLYGLSLADFKELVLIPKAQREILEGRLFLEKKNFQDWLSEAEKSAKIFILTPEFYWDNDQVKLRS